MGLRRGTRPRGGPGPDAPRDGGGAAGGTTGGAAGAASPADLIAPVVDDGNCTGCGLCAAVFPGSVHMDLDEAGFLRPVVDPAAGPVAAGRAEAFRSACPGVTQVLRPPAGSRTDPVLGPHLAAFVGWASDPVTRFEGSSGGVITALSQWMLESGGARRVACATASGTQPSRTVPVTLGDPRSVLSAAGSRYAPVGVAALADEVGAPDVLVGKPCETCAVRQWNRGVRDGEDRGVRDGEDHGVRDGQVPDHPGSANTDGGGHPGGTDTGVAHPASPDTSGATRATAETAGPPLLISFFCAGTPSQFATSDLVANGGIDAGDLVSVRYRGRGWPGEFEAVSARGVSARLGYEESWGGTLGKRLQSACKTCPDGLGLFADIAVGDFWTSDDQGFPVFDDAEGRSVVIARTPRGLEALRLARDEGVLVLFDHDLDDGSVQRTQPFQVRRRRMVGPRRWGKRLAGARVPRLEGLVLWGWALRHPRQAWREARGTARRTRAARRARGDRTSTRTGTP